MDTDAFMPVEEPCVAVRLEFHPPPLSFKAPLPLLPVITQAKVYHRARVVYALPSGSKLRPEARHTFPLVSRREGRREIGDEAVVGCLQLRAPGGDGGGRKAVGEEDVDSTTPPGYATPLRDCVKRAGQTKAGGTSPRTGRDCNAYTGDIELFIREDIDPPRDSVKRYPSLTNPRRSLGLEDHKLDETPRDGPELRQHKERSQVTFERRGARFPVAGISKANRWSMEDARDPYGYMISNIWTLPSERALPWNKPRLSVDKLVKGFENPGNAKKKIDESPVANPSGSRRLSKTSRIPVLSLAERFTATSGGGKEYHPGST